MNQNDINLVNDYSNFMEEYIDSDLEHYGVPKMRWHHRRWQYEDGSLTPAGREHYGVGPPRSIDPEHPITSRMAKAAQAFQERRAVAKIYAEKEARTKRLQEGKKTAKLKREQRAKLVKEMTRTPDDLVKNRDKLTDEEFKAAVEKFEKLKQIDTENAALLKKYNGLKDDSPKEETDDDEDDYTDPLAGQHWGMARARKYQNPDGTLTEEGKDKFLNDSRAAKVAKWTKTAEDLVKNRDKLTDEEFKQAVIRFDQERNKKLENEAILKAFGGASDYEQRRQARSAEKVAEAYRKYNAKELIKHKGEFTKEEFDQLKVLVAAKSTSDLKKLTTYLSADEYQTALDRYAKTEGARKGQVVQDLRNTGSNVKSIVDMIDQGYKVADNASKMTTGRSIQDLAKNATGTAFMSLLEKADLENALSRAKASKAAADSAEAVTQGVADVLKRAKNMTDKEYAEAMAPYYDDVMDILTGNSGKNDKKNNKGDKNQNPQNNPQQQGNKKKDKQGGEPFPNYQEQKGSSDAQSTSESPKKKKKEKQQSTQEPNVGHNLGNTTIGGKKPENMGFVYEDAGHYHEDLKFGTKAQNAKRSIFETLGGQDTSNMKSNQDASHKVEREIFGKNNTSNMEVKPDALHKVKEKFGGNKSSNMETELERAFRTTDTGKSTITFGSKKAIKTPTLSFDDPFAGHDFSKASLTFDSAPTKHAPTLSFGGDDDDGPAPKVKPMSSKEYDDIMSKLTNDITDFQRKTSTDYKPNVTVDDVYDEVMRKLRG